MKKLFIISLAVMFILPLSASIVLAGGDQVHGEKGQGGVYQECVEPGGECPWEQ